MLSWPSTSAIRVRTVEGAPLIGRFAISSTFQSCYRTLGVSLKSSLRSNRIEFLRNSLLFKLARRVCSIMFATQTIHETEGFNSCRRQFMTVLPSIHCLLNSNLHFRKNEVPNVFYRRNKATTKDI